MPGLRGRHIFVRGKLAAGGALTIVAAAIVVIVLATSSGSSQGANRSSAASGSTTVQRRNLVATDTESGTLSYADSQTVFNRESGTITWLPAIGDVIQPGHTLYDVDNSPVVLFDGTTPAFRALSPSASSGPDVLELNRDLVALGFDPSRAITVDDVWQTATTDAVDRWQAALGETETGTIPLGQVVFLPGLQRVTAIDTVLGSTGGSGGGGSSASGAGSSSSGSGASSTGASTTVLARPEFVSLTTTTSSSAIPSLTPPPQPGKHKMKKAPTSSAALLKAMAALLKAETQALRSSRSSSAGGAASRSSGSTSRSGGATASKPSGATGSGAASSSAGSASGASAQAIMQSSSTQLVVTVDLDATKQSEAVVGELVTVQLPSGDTVNGKITQVSPVAQSSSSSSSGSSSGSGAAGAGSSSSGSTVPVTITLSRRLRGSGLDQAAVSVNFQQQVANNVLSVPVTALLATQGGGYAVQEAQAPHRLIPVTPGLFAAGYVQISGPGIYAGLEVTDSQG